MIIKIGDEAEEDTHTKIKVISTDPVQIQIVKADSYIGWTNSFYVGQIINMKSHLSKSDAWVISDSNLPWYILWVDNLNKLRFEHYR
jgi:hypothetical protein